MVDYSSMGSSRIDNSLVGWLCLTSHRHRGHLETATPFTVPCEGNSCSLRAGKERVSKVYHH